MLAMSKVLNLKIHQLDVDSAFPYADLDKEVYMALPPGMDLQEGYCLKLDKSLYGLKQAPAIGTKISLSTLSQLVSSSAF